MDEKEVSEMQEEMMTVLVVEPMKAPYVKNIPNELEDLQQAVGGDIEMTYPFDDKVGILLNGNGKFEGLPLNRALYDDHGQVYDAIAGTFLVVGLTEDDFTSLTPGQIEKFKEKYQSPEIFTLFNGELHVMKMPPEEAKNRKKAVRTMQNQRIRQRRKTDPGMQDKIFFCEVNKKIHCHRLVSRGTSLGCSLASEYRHYRYVPNRRSVTV